MKNSIEQYTHYADTVQQINQYAALPGDFIRRVEEKYQNNLTELAEAVLAGCLPHRIHTIMLSGPSSSSKTTTARQLVERFRQKSREAVLISLDDFYLGDEHTPLDADGKPDYETVEALNIEQLNDCLLNLMQHGSCNLPIFDFEYHRPFAETRPIELGPDSIVVVEGIHALNPQIVQRLPKQGLTRIYISVKQGISDHEQTLLTPNDIRLIRRIVRDHQFRNMPPAGTLAMWPSVMSGEYRYIKPYRCEADFTINSFHSYEPCVFRGLLAPLLSSIQPGSEHAQKARQLQQALALFTPIPFSLVPPESVLWEFIGNPTV